MPKMIIFEGHECAGKTTLVSRMADEFSAKVQKGVRIADRFQLVKSVVDDITTQLVRTSVGNGESLILVDRWPAISDIIYEKYCYGTTSIMESVLPDLKQTLKDADITIVYLRTTQAEMLSRFWHRGDKLRTSQEAIVTYDAYERFFSPGECPVDFVTIDVTDLNPEEAFIKACETLDLPVPVCMNV